MPEAHLALAKFKRISTIDFPAYSTIRLIGQWLVEHNGLSYTHTHVNPYHLDTHINPYLLDTHKGEQLKHNYSVFKHIR